MYVWAMEQEIHKVKSKYLKEKTVDNNIASDFQSNNDEVDITNLRLDGCSKCTSSYSGLHQSSKHNCDTENKDINSSLPSGNDNATNNSQCDNTTQKTDRLKQETNQNFIGARPKEFPNNNSPVTTHSDDKKPSHTLGVHKNRTHFQQQDLLVPWQLKNKPQTEQEHTTQDHSVFHRYYHVFNQGELENLCQKLTSCKVIGGYYDQGNWAVVLQKT